MILTLVSSIIRSTTASGVMMWMLLPKETIYPMKRELPLKVRAIYVISQREKEPTKKAPREDSHLAGM